MKNKDNKRRIIFFDFDGVIADSFSILFEINKSIDPKIKTKDDYSNLFNGNINDWKKNSSLDEEEIKKIDEDFSIRYSAQIARVNIFPGIKDVVAELSKSHTIIIISSTITSLIEKLLRRHDMLSYFDKFTDGGIVHNNKTERIFMALKKYSAEPRDCIFITDTLGDMREAASCGVVSIGVAWGVQTKENLLKAKPIKIVEKPDELLSVVSNYFETFN